MTSTEPASCVALRTKSTEDLRPLAAWLRARGVPHRIFEASAQLVVSVPDPALVPIVEEGVALLRRGELAWAPAPGGTPRFAAALVRIALGQPTTVALVLLTLIWFPLTLSSIGPVAAFTERWLMIVPIERIGGFISFASLPNTLAAGEIWRLWTPALLHFGALHLVFNLLWLYELGRRIETGRGSRQLLEAFILIAPIANVAQYLMDAGPLFGGMSGVVYGLLGYLLIASRRDPHPALRLPPALTVMMLLFLVFFATGATEPFGLRVANGAHWGGLLAGMVLALLRVRAPRTEGSEPS